jgi:hypothetical protein
MDTPNARRTDVLRRGTSKGFSGLMLVGGQQTPRSGVGVRLEWKKAQKIWQRKILLR